MSAVALKLPERAFAELVSGIAFHGDRVLDAGCGSGEFYPFHFQQAGVEVIGIDRDSHIADNQHLRARVRGDAANLPFADASFDVVHCRWLLEHLERPSNVLAEFHRVLKPGGKVALFTTNLLHYYGMAARLTPHWFHLWFNRRVRGFRETEIFRTRYRANTIWRMRRLLQNAGFHSIQVELLEGSPSVLAFNPLFHRIGTIYAQLVTHFDFLRPFRMNLLALASKSSGTSIRLTKPLLAEIATEAATLSHEA